jgi:hypothetical protein
LQHPLAQHLEARPTIGLPLQELQAVDVTLDRSLAPFKSEPGFHGVIVFPQALRKALQFRHPLLLDSRSIVVNS